MGLLKATTEMGMQVKIDLLDRGYIRLVDHMGSDLSIVRSARVSHDADWRSGEDEGSDDKLIKYLYVNRHTTPFEAVVFTFEVKAPIFVFRQWHRHRTWSYNELSARYTELPEECYVPSITDIGTQSKTNKQAREITDLTEEEENHRAYSVNAMSDHNSEAFLLYRSLLEAGTPREIARSVLPVSTYSRMFATVNLHNLFHFLRLRMDSHAQYEIRVYANAMLELVRDIVPTAARCFEEDFLSRS